MKQEISVLEWQKNFTLGRYLPKDRHTQCQAGWYDWFCKDESLANKTKRMGNIIAKVKEGGKVDLKNNYVWFKNNCPCCYPLYDDFRFADLKTGEVQFTIQCDHPFGSEYLYEVYGRNNDFKTPLFQCNNSRELVKWLNTPWGN